MRDAVTFIPVLILGSIALGMGISAYRTGDEYNLQNRGLGKPSLALLYIGIFLLTIPLGVVVPPSWTIITVPLGFIAIASLVIGLFGWLIYLPKIFWPARMIEEHRQVKELRKELRQLDRNPYLAPSRPFRRRIRKNPSHRQDRHDSK